MNNGSRSFAPAITDMDSSDRHLNFVAALANFRGTPSYVPDSNTNPAILTSANVTDSIPITAANTDMALLVLPKHRGGTVGRGKIVLAGTTVTASDGVSYTFPSNAFVPQYFYPQSRQLNASYNFVRPSSMGVQVQSNAAPNSSNNITGTLSGASFNSVNDLQTYTVGELQDAAITNGDYRSNVSVTEGLVSVAGPEIVGDFIQVDGATTEYSSYTKRALTSSVINTGGGTSIVPGSWPIYRNVYYSKVSTKVLTLCTSTSGCAIRVFYYRLYFDNSWVLTMAPTEFPELNGSMLAVAGNSTGQNAGVTSRFDIDLITSGGMLAPVFSAKNVAGTNVTVQITGYFEEQSNRSGLGPGSMILAQGLGVGQNLIIDGRINYEAIPNAGLTKDVKTDFYLHRSAPTMVHEIPLAEAVFNSPNSPVDRVMTLTEHRVLLQHAGEYATMHGAMRYSFGWTDLWNIGKKVLSYVPKFAPIVGSAFGPEGTMIGSQVGDLASNLNSALGIRNSASKRMRHGMITNGQTFYSKVTPTITETQRGTLQESPGHHSTPLSGTWRWVVLSYLLISLTLVLILTCLLRRMLLTLFSDAVLGRLRLGRLSQLLYSLYSQEIELHGWNAFSSAKRRSCPNLMMEC